MFRILLFCLLLHNVNVFSISFNYTNGPNLNSKRHFHQSQKLQDGRIIVFGGYDGYLESPTFYTSSEIYDPITNSWSAGPNMNDTRYNHMSVVLNNGNVMAIGGITPNTNSYVEIYNPVTNSWSAGPSPRYGYYGGGAVTLKDGRVLLAGGLGKDESFVEMYIPALNKWVLGPTMNFFHGEGLTLNLLSSGKVLAIGGKSASKVIEV